MAENEQPRDVNENEGEGTRSGDAQYRAGIEDHLRKGKIEEEAEQARRDVEASPDEFRKAEEEGKRRSAGDLEEDAAGI
jgi:hypothetical protein